MRTWPCRPFRFPRESRSAAGGHGEQQPGEIPNLLDGNYNTAWHSAAEGQQWILVDFGSPHGVDWAWIDMTGDVTLESSNDGIAFQTVARLHGPQWNLIYEAVPSTTARWFRVVVPKRATVRDLARGTRAEVQRAAQLAAKRALTHPMGVTTTRQADQVRFVREDLAALPTDRPLKTGGMVDLTGRTAADGTLDWKAPPGTWKIVRIGRTTTGSAAAAAC